MSGGICVAVGRASVDENLHLSGYITPVRGRCDKNKLRVKNILKNFLHIVCLNALTRPVAGLASQAIGNLQGTQMIYLRLDVVRLKGPHHLGYDQRGASFGFWTSQNADCFQNGAPIQCICTSFLRRHGLLTRMLSGERNAFPVRSAIIPYSAWNNKIYLKQDKSY
jgi:hypothetical protein